MFFLCHVIERRQVYESKLPNKEGLSAVFILSFFFAISERKPKNDIKLMFKILKLIK